MAWIYLTLAGIEEIISVIAMKYVDGFKRKWPIAVMVIGFGFSFFFLSRAMQILPSGVAYAFWMAVGAIGISLVGLIWFKEKLSWLQWMFLIFILIGAIGLKATA
ncbi:multidrug efflux SMR transporter [Bacillus aquiflavi]|uniref:Multidrug efflux SMR transporter n=1 Tax=Bacillus aquiflavi TaxID=2672567 RepID=A0A6B3VP63_9BACI|nr:multidrug efflux SMR transporter [Bacillus aquiflavi]MBA4535724.1 multidrug efflux SMR transporter [Bacillus aquiflavi]NEY80100.1 multidrug efflux SMR transporter [Bacillus aquiflavi]UAC48005.1 multidrug efflux SMR transporter [Bacillus aquiflavi]